MPGTQELFATVESLSDALFGGNASPLAVKALGSAERATRRREFGPDGLPNLHSIGIDLSDPQRPSVAFFAVDPQGVTDLPPDIDGARVVLIQSAPARVPEIAALSQPQGVVDPCSARRTGLQRPATSGISVGHPAVTAGTIGCVCRSIHPAEEGRFILGNNHVLAATNQAQIGDVLLQPGPADGGRDPIDGIATLTRFIPLALGLAARNVADAAIGRVIVPMDDDVCGIGPLAGTVAATSGMPVRKHGRTTGLTAGVVRFVGIAVALNYRGVPTRFLNQIRVEPAGGVPFSQGGDSGSVVVTDDPTLATGLLFAGPDDGSYTLVNPIDLVLAGLQATI